MIGHKSSGRVFEGFVKLKSSATEQKADSPTMNPGRLKIMPFARRHMASARNVGPLPLKGTVGVLAQCLGTGDSVIPLNRFDSVIRTEFEQMLCQKYKI